MQDERITDPEECRRDCLESVRGWSSEITRAIESTPLERITRSKIVDRLSATPLLLCIHEHPLVPCMA